MVLSPFWQLIQQYGREIITRVPDAANAVTAEVQAMREPYIDKAAYLLRGRDVAERDACDHRVYDSMSAWQRKLLAESQIELKLSGYRNTDPKHRRPWTGANEFRELHAESSLTNAPTQPISNTNASSLMPRVDLDEIVRKAMLKNRAERDR